MKGKKLITNLSIFEGVREETLDRMLTVGKIQEYAKGTIYIRAREEVASVYFQV